MPSELPLVDGAGRGEAGRWLRPALSNRRQRLSQRHWLQPATIVPIRLDTVLISVYSNSMTPLIVLDGSVDEPVYAQIARQIRAQIASGGLAPDTLLPPVRTIASDLGVNLNTVARAYRLLETEGFVGIEQREGVRVRAPARRADRSALDELGEQLSVLVARMRQVGLSPAEIRRRVERELAAMGKP